MYPFVFKNRDPARVRRCGQVIYGITRLSHIPGFGLHPWFQPGRTDLRWLPVNEDIAMGDDMPMPVTILDRLIEEASHRMIYDFCGCRVGSGCEHYPLDLGCLMMGDSAAGANPGFCREVDAAEAKGFARKAVGLGLVPVVGKARIDNSIFGIKDTGRLLTVCFCCDCCCLTRFWRHSPLELLDRMMAPLEGVLVEVTDGCTGCGTCVEKCYMKAIEIVDGKAALGVYCRGCGRCASVCPNDAIRVALTDPDYVDKAIARIRSYVTYD